MTTRNAGLTRRQHVELGAILLAVREILTDAVRAVNHGYPITSHASRDAQRTLEVFDALRATLELAAANELPAGQWSTAIYYAESVQERQRYLDEHPVDEAEAGLDDIR